MGQRAVVATSGGGKFERGRRPHASTIHQLACCVDQGSSWREKRTGSERRELMHCWEQVVRLNAV